jgi:hypothetical protein
MTLYHDAECHAECCILLIDVLNVIMLSVMAPYFTPTPPWGPSGALWERGALRSVLEVLV